MPETSSFRRWQLRNQPSQSRVAHGEDLVLHLGRRMQYPHRISDLADRRGIRYDPRHFRCHRCPQARKPDDQFIDIGGPQADFGRCLANRRFGTKVTFALSDGMTFLSSFWSHLPFWQNGYAHWLTPSPAVPRSANDAALCVIEKYFSQSFKPPRIVWQILPQISMMARSAHAPQT